MRSVRIFAALLLVASVTACTEDPTNPKLLPSFDVAPGSEFSQVGAGIQPTSDYAAFIAASGAVMRADYRTNENLLWRDGWWSANPYRIGGLTISHKDGLWVRVGNITSLIDGREMTFDGEDSFIVDLPNLVTGFGIRMVDNYAHAPNGSAPKADSRWQVKLWSGCRVVGSFWVDPPKDQVFFIGMQSQTPFSRVQFTETPDGWPGAENDWWGPIYTSASLGAPPVNHPPLVQLPGIVYEGTPFSFAQDPDDDPLTYSWWVTDWSWVDVSGTSATISIPDEGNYEVFANAADACVSAGLDEYVEVQNVAPAVTLGPATAELLPGETWRGSGSFIDPGADQWNGSVSFGDGGSSQLNLNANSFQLEHIYTQPGTFTLTATVSDEDGGIGQGTATVNVITPAAGSAVLQQQVNAFVTSGALPAQEAKPLLESLQGVVAAVARAEPDAALGKLGAFDNKLDALLRSRRITPEAHSALKDYSARLRKSISG